MTDLSGYSIPQQQPYGIPPQQDESINLTMGIDTTGGLATGVVPEGTHRFRTSYEGRQWTGNGEVMLNVDCLVIESHTPGAQGQKHTERLVVPGDVRKQTDPQKWQTMMKMLRLKLEGITGRPFRQDNIDLSPTRDLNGCVFIARCYHEESKVEQDDGTERIYKNSRLTDWTPPGTSQQAPAQSMQQGTLVPPTPGPVLGQAMQQAPPQPSITLGQQMAAAAAQATPATPGPIAQMPVQQGQRVEQMYDAAMQDPAVQAAHQAEVNRPPTEAEAAAIAAMQQASQPAVGLGGMTFPIGPDQQQAPAQTPVEPAKDPAEEPF